MTATSRPAAGWLRASTPDSTTSTESSGAPALQCLGVEEVEFAQPGLRAGYFQTRGPEELPGAPDTELVLLDRAYHYVRVAPHTESWLRLILPDRFGPPEKCFWDKAIVETDRPGIIWNSHGKGRAAYFPWEVSRLYHDLCIHEHRLLIAAAVERTAGEKVARCSCDSRQ